jgi:hypothetical protein
MAPNFLCQAAIPWGGAASSGAAAYNRKSARPTRAIRMNFARRRVRHALWRSTLLVCGDAVVDQVSDVILFRFALFAECAARLALVLVDVANDLMKRTSSPILTSPSPQADTTAPSSFAHAARDHRSRHPSPRNGLSILDLTKNWI